MKNMLMSVWSFRHFIISSVLNEFRLRFIRSKLGGMWGIIHPLVQVAIFAFILSHVLSSKLPGIDNPYAYAIYLMAGVLGWNLFAETLQRSMTVFIDNGNLLKKIAFPRISLPIILVGGVLLNNILLLLAILIIFLLLGHLPGIQVLWLPLLMLVTVVFGLGLGLVLGIMNVFLRDIGQVVPIVLQILYWFTPIVYMVSIIPEQYRSWLLLNPMYLLVDAYHQVLVFNHAPHLVGVGMIAVVALLLLVAAMNLFRKAGPEMVDML